MLLLFTTSVRLPSCRQLPIGSTRVEVSLPMQYANSRDCAREIGFSETGLSAGSQLPIRPFIWRDVIIATIHVLSRMPSRVSAPRSHLLRLSCAIGGKSSCAMQPFQAQATFRLYSFQRMGTVHHSPHFVSGTNTCYFCYWT